MNSNNPSTDRLRDLFRASIADVAECNKHVDLEDTQFWRRVAYRTIFATFEALISHAKQAVLRMHEDDHLGFTDAEVFALREIEFHVDDTGAVIERKAKIRFLANLHLALSALSRAHGTEFVAPKNSGWDSLTKSVKVRDRLTHPKSANDFQISDVEKRYLDEAWDWFGEALIQAVHWDKEG